AVALEELVELRAVATRELRGLRDAAVRELEDAREVVALEALARVLERRHLVHLHLDRLLDERARDHFRRAERDGLLDHVVELAHVAGPARLGEELERFRRERRLVARISRREVRKEMVREKRNVLAPLRERGKLESDHVEPIVEVLAECPEGFLAQQV